MKVDVMNHGKLQNSRTNFSLYRWYSSFKLELPNVLTASDLDVTNHGNFQNSRTNHSFYR